MAEIGAVEPHQHHHRAGQTGALQPRALEIHPVQARPVELHVGEIGAVEAHIGQARFDHGGVIEVGARQIHVGHARAQQLGVGEVGAGEVAAEKLGVGQIAVGEIAALAVSTDHQTLVRIFAALAAFAGEGRLGEGADGRGGQKGVSQAHGLKPSQWLGRYRLNSR